MLAPLPCVSCPMLWPVRWTKYSPYPASAITRQPVLAGFAALIVSLSLWFADWANRLDPASSSLGTVSTLGRLRGFAIGFINSADIAYFIIVAVLFFTFAVWSVESERQWA